MKPLKYFFNNLKLAKKFALIFGLSLVLLCLVGIFIIGYIRDKYNQELYGKTQMAMSYLAADLETDLKEVATAADYLIENQKIQSALALYNESGDTEEKARSKRLIYDNLYSYFNSMTAITSIVVQLTDGVSVRLGYSNQDFTKDSWKKLEKASDDAGGRLVWHGGENFQNMAVCARQIRRKEYLKLDKLATLFIEVDMEKLISRTAETSDAFLILQTANDRIYYPASFPGELAKTDFSSVSDYKILRTGDGIHFVTVGNLPYTGWQYAYFFDYEDLFAHLNKALRGVLFLLAATTLLVIGLEYRIIRRITSHFQILEQKMQHFESGSRELLQVPYDYSERGDEIGMLHRRFDQTVRNYQKLVLDNYQNQLLLKDASIKNLQQQIHPHFLYNVLDSIYLMAEAHHVSDIGNMALALANLFRASASDSAPTIPLRSELNYLDSYIQIQLIRFQSRLCFHSSCDEGCMDVMIPKLSIQPLAENAIRHGIEESSEDCQVILQVEDRPEGTYIAVANTGSRFPENMAAFSADGPEASDTPLVIHGIGLKNINQRLQLIYGPSCHLHFYNTASHAVVYFIIPKGGN